MKNTFFLLLALLFSCTLLAQKVKGENIRVEYTRLPATPLNPEFTTYSAIVYGSPYSLEGVGFTAEGLANQYLKLRGFKQVKDGNGHFRIAVRVGYLRILSETTKSIKRTKENKDGTKTNYTVYKKVLTYRMPLSYAIEDYEGRSIATGIAENREYTYSTSEYKSLNQLNDYWRVERGRRLDNFRKDRVRGGMSTISNLVQRNYDFSRIEDKRVDIYVMKNSKDDAGFLKAYEGAKTAFSQMSADVAVDQIKMEIRPSLEFWMEKKEQYSRDHKKEKKYVFACLYNLAVVYYYLDELSEARNFAFQCGQLDFKEGQVKGLLKRIENTRLLMEKNKSTSRHILINLERAVPPSSSKFSTMDEPLNALEKGVQIAGYILFQDDRRVEGTFEIKAEQNEELSFGPDGNISFLYIEGSRTQTHNLSPTQLKGFGFKDRSFLSIPYSTGNSGVTKSEILEVLYGHQKVSVYKYYPYDNQLGNGQVEFAFQKRTDLAPVSVSGSAFLLFNKGLADFFADCSELSEAAKAGEFKKEQGDIIRAARVYAELCQEP